ncbi:MAG: hydantoinase B/oxoprolinase family protein [Meiothermus sp.]|nr:hydantoinase B/oxoprolinase family protein [Meiothermus sp.]
MKTSLDPITLEIIQNSLQAISDEMFAAMRKTAMSAIIYEVLDMGTGITDGAGRMATSGAGIPGFVGVLDKAVQGIIRLHPRSEIHPGDVFVTNDPYYGGVTHLSDIVLVMPVFAGKRLIAWTANIAHWNDIGGMVAGSMSSISTEIFQEGLRLPAVKLIERGRPIRAVLEIMKTNSRLPDYLLGDMWAGIAALRVGERRILELAGKYGVGTFEAALERHFDYGERVALAALKTLPKGRFSLEEVQENGDTYKVTVEITDTTFTVDLRDNPPQNPGPYNISGDAALVSTQMFFKAITDSSRGANAGHLRPIRLHTRPGTVFHVREPGAAGYGFEVSMRLYDLLWRCLAPHLGPHRLPAGHFASICGTVIGGVNPDTGRYFTIVEPQIGGWGATAERDGLNANYSSAHGETLRCPVEVAEARYGLYVDQFKLNDAPGGEGEFCGGKGIVLDYRVRSDGCFLTVSYTRSRFKPWALAGGREGSSNHVEIIRRDGSRETYATVTALRLNKDDVIRIHTANGGGYGDPARRSRGRVLEDLKNGYVSAEGARAVFGVEP